VSSSTTIALTEAAGSLVVKAAPVVYRSSEEVRELIIDWVEKHKTVPTQPDNNWRIIGAQ